MSAPGKSMRLWTSLCIKVSLATSRLFCKEGSFEVSNRTW